MPYRVLLLSHHGRTVAGGAPLADLALADALRRLGNTVDALFYDDALPSWVRATWRQLAFPWAAAVVALRRWHRARYDVIDSTAGDAWVLRLALRLFPGRRPLMVIRTHGLEHRRAELEEEQRCAAGGRLSAGTRLYHFRYRLREVACDLAAADAVFLLNQEDARHAIERLGISPKRIHVLPNGVPDELLALPAPEPDPERRFHLLFLGAWSPQKGADLLPGIASHLFAQDARFRLTCAGTGGSAEAVLADFAPGDHERVRALPRYERSELPQLLSGHGVFLFPSPAEGSSLALLEAMAGGLVPVVTRTGQAADLIVPGENGFLVERGDEAGFVAAVLAATAAPEASWRIGMAARQSTADCSWTARAAERVRIWDGLRKDGHATS